jgi:hypothetical protein
MGRNVLQSLTIIDNSFFLALCELTLLLCALQTVLQHRLSLNFDSSLLFSLPIQDYFVAGEQ